MHGRLFIGISKQWKGKSRQLQKRFGVLAASREPREGARSSLAKLIQDLKQQPPVQADNDTYKQILRLCGDLGALAEGKFVDAHIAANGLEDDRFLGNCLIFMYAKCGSVQDAQRVFDKLTKRNLITWNGLITAYALNGHCEHAIRLFRQMQFEGSEPDSSSFTTIFNACTKLGAIADAKLIYSTIAGGKYVCDVNLNNALLNTYSKCGSVRDVESQFGQMPGRNVVSWTILVSAYAQNGHIKQAIRSMQRMQLEGIQPNKVTFIAVLEVCIRHGGLETGRRIHACMSETGLDTDVVVGTTLVDMYTKCGSLQDARRVFDRMDTSDVISWTAMIAAYVKNEQGREALKLFKLMQLEGVKPNCVTCLICLNACAGLTALAEGRFIHEKIVESGFEETHINVGNALVDMYGSCGILDVAKRVFDRMHRKDVSSWNALIVAFAQHGQSSLALEFFGQMQQEGVDGDRITFIGVLCACSCAGMLVQGHQYYVSMIRDHGVMVSFEHYGCLVDLLSRVGWLDAAEELISVMPFYPDDRKWMALLGACRIHGDADRGQRAAQQSLELTPHDSSPYVVLSSIYAAQGHAGDEENAVEAECSEYMPNLGISEELTHQADYSCAA